MNYKNYHRDKTYLENESLFRNIFSKRFNVARKFFSKNSKTVLDIGASNGVMLDIFAEKGFETWGIEPSKSGKVAEHKGHRILHTFFENAKLPNNFFDVVILNHTLEHMDDPVLVMKKIYQILKKGAIVYVDVPNAGGLGAKLLGDNWPYRLPKEHKHQFTKKSLQEIFKVAGFKVIHFESRSGIFEFANPIKEIFESLFTFKKRFFTDLIYFPYSLVATIFNMGDSMSMIGRK